MFWIYEILKGKESKAREEKQSLSYFDLEWSKLENWYFDINILR